ncbi:MAG: carboxypeptidase regulatory-like domain-containing protein [Opitutales bacterium]|nr:carboxypeptidase regulatory-like domain-containing protein [Opitutales bacterium]
MKKTFLYLLPAILGFALVLIWSERRERTDNDISSAPFLENSSGWEEPVEHQVPESSAASPEGRSLVELQDEMVEQSQRFKSGDLPAADREEVVAEMVELATERRDYLLSLLPHRHNYVREQLFSPDEIDSFPPEVQALMETYVRGRGDFYVFCASPIPDGSFPVHGISYEVRYEDRVYRAHPNEQWEAVVAGDDYAFAAATLEDEMLLLEEPEDEEVLAGPTGTDGQPNPGGANKMLYMIARFADESDFAQSASQANSRFSVTNTYYRNNSQDKMYFLAQDGTTEGGDLMDIVFVDMPESRSYYENISNTSTRLSELLSDARSAAGDQGFDHSTYNTDAIVTSGSSWGYAGIAWLGSKGTHMPQIWTELRTFGHELGHNFNLAHAYYWRTDAAKPLGKDSRPGGYVTDNDMDEAIEYAHYFSIMSAQHSSEISDPTKPHFAPYEKHRMGLLEEGSELLLVDTSGQYRVYRHDTRDWENSARAIRIEAPATIYTGNQNFRYWLGMRYSNWNTARDYQRRGLQVDIAEDVSFRRYPIQLDMTPFTHISTTFYDPSSPPGNWWTIDNNDKRDGALMVGRTYSDREAGIHITPIAFDHTESGEEFVDVVINLGQFTDNEPPEINEFTVSSTTVNTGETVTFEVDASDPDGDDLAYGWEFDPVGSFTNSGFNESTASKSWGSPGQYKVKVTVSDMKGGIASETAVITVGEPSNNREIWGRVLQAGQPLANARVHIGTNHQVWTDTDGSYRLVGLSPGTHTVSAMYDGVEMTADFSNPVDVSEGNAYGMDFDASGGGGSDGDEPTGSISGSISSSIGSVEGVEVEAGGIVAVTDANGDFTIEGLVEGGYEITAYKGSRYNELGNQEGWAFASSPFINLSSGDNANLAPISRETFTVSGRVQGMDDDDPAPTIFTADGRSVTASWPNQGNPHNRRWEYSFTAGSRQVNLFAEADGFVIEPDFGLPLQSTGGNLNNRDFDASSGSIAGSIQGQVLHDGQPLAGVTVSAGGTSIRTDSDGYYLIPNLSSGSYDVMVSHPGVDFAPSSHSGVSVPATGMDFEASGLSIDSVTVSADFVTLGSSVDLEAAISGGTGDYTLEWRGWEVAGPVSFTQNDGSSLTTSASFVNTGAHVMRLAVEDANGMRVTETISVTVVSDDGGSGSLAVTPFKSELFSGETRTFTARAWNSTGEEVEPDVSWSSDGGIIDSETGLFSPTESGFFTITATDPAFGTAEATVSVEGTFEAPVISLLPEGNIIFDEAELNADLSEGGSNVEIDVWWGTEDGGSDSAAWQNIYEAGLFDQGEISLTLPGLEPETDYFYRMEARNSIGEDQTETGQFTTTEDLSGIEPEITLIRPTVPHVRVPEGVGLVLITEVTETGDGSDSLTQEWTVESGPGTVTWDNTTEPETAAFFSELGTYELRLTADNGVYSDVLDITVEVVESFDAGGGGSASGALSENLAVYLPLDESSGQVAGDASGNDRDGQIEGDPEWRPEDGKFGGALRFTGSSQYALLADSEGLDDVAQMSWSWWMRPEAENSDVRGILSKRESANSGQAWSFFLHNDNQLNLDMPSSGNRLQVGTIPANEWTHVAVVFDGSQSSNERVRVYLDGVFSNAYSADITTLPSRSNSVTLGMLDTGDTRSFRGDLDEVLIYHGRALSTQDVEQIYEGIGGNVGPWVLAGTERTVSLGQVVALSGTVEDDGLPEDPGEVTTEWLQIEGPAAVSFTEPGNLETDVEFTQSGSYTLRLTAFDGEVMTAHDKPVTVDDDLEEPEVTDWPTASDLVYGQTLAESTLTGGEASVEGSFAFTYPETVPDAGTEMQSVTFTPEDTETYSSVVGEVEVTVEPAEATVTLSNMTRTYNATPLSPTVTTDPEGLAVTLTFDGSSEVPVDADAYEVVATVDDPNATGSASGTFVIDPAPITVAAEDQVKTLGEDDPELTWTVTSGQVFDGDSLSGELTREAGEDVGEYVIDQGTLSASSNYDLTFVPGTLTIEPGEVTIALIRPTVSEVRIPEGVGLVLETDVSEDGGESGQLTLAWIQESGEGDVSWETTDSPETVAWFSEQGSYTLRLTADNGTHSETLDIEVEVVDPALIEGVEEQPMGSPAGSEVVTISGWNISSPAEVSALGNSYQADFADVPELTGAQNASDSGQGTYVVVQSNATWNYADGGSVEDNRFNNYRPEGNSNPGVRLSNSEEYTGGRAVGFGRGGSPLYGLRFVNNTSETINEVAVDYSAYWIEGTDKTYSFAWAVTPSSVENPSGENAESDGPLSAQYRNDFSGLDLVVPESNPSDPWMNNNASLEDLTWEPGETLWLLWQNPQGNDSPRIHFDTITITPDYVPAEQNIGPLVDAGGPQTVNSGEEVTLDGSVQDDGLPLDPGTVTTEWIQVSGPESVSFSDPTILDPTFTTETGGDYVFRLIAFDGEVATADEVGVTVEASIDPPQISSHPEDQSVMEGESVTFIVEAEGEGTLLYQWRKDGEAIDEATSSTLTLDPVVLEDAGTYTVVVSNDGGSTTSDEAVLTVEEDPYEAWLREHDLEDDGETTVTKDGSEVTLREAYLLGNDPHDPSDVLRIKNTEVQAGGDSLNVYFPSLENRYYQVELSDDLSADSWTIYGEGFMGDDTERYFTVPMDTETNPRRFYRIRVSFPE